jgi:bifunctional UDP-N-acetylglucosamine pyrophosphorylase/glucosamine-1-phosphate N-acetyltransferase
MSTAALIPAGEGTRMRSDLPKVAHCVLGVPMVRLVLEVARAAAIERVVIVTGHGAETVAALVPGETLVLQESQLGTGHAVMSAMPAFAGFEGSLVVLSGDTPLLRADTVRALVEERERSGAAVAVLTTRMPDPTGYGRVVRDADGALARIVEQKDLAPEMLGIDEVNTGTYCFDAVALSGHLDKLTAENAQGEYYLTDMVGHLREEGLGVSSLTAEDAAETLGVNTRAQLAEATKVLQRRVNTAHMLAGVTMIDPDLVWVAPGVRLGRDVVLEPMTTLMGKTDVADGAHIGPNARLTDTSVGERARVDASVVIDAEIGPDATVGPMAFVRAGTALGVGAKVGAFVEFENTIAGDGSKVPHLSHMGDATIGTGQTDD